MTAVTRTAPARTVTDWKRFLIIGLCALTLLTLLFTTQLDAVNRKTDEALSLSGLDFLMGRTPGKSEGTPHPMLISALVFALMCIAAAAFAPDNFIYSIIGAIFLAVSVFMFRFDVTYQAKGEFGLDKDSLVFTIGWVTAMVLAIINLGCVI